MLWECFPSTLLLPFPTLYLLTHHINESPLYLRKDGAITVFLPIASYFSLPDPSLFSLARCFKAYLCNHQQQKQLRSWQIDARQI